GRRPRYAANSACRSRTELFDFHGAPGWLFTRQYLWFHLCWHQRPIWSATRWCNEAVLNMLDEIQKEGLSPEQFMENVKDKESGIRLMGFGHRVYKNYDPRARIVKSTAEKILNKLGAGDERLEIAMR